MKLKLYIFCIAMVLSHVDMSFGAVADKTLSTSWWLQPTICKLNTTNCYSDMGIGYDKTMWDSTSNCWGVKMICPEATTYNNTSYPVAMTKSEIANGNNIDSSFDVTVLNGDCYGTRKTISNGSVAVIDGSNVKVWCTGVLNNPSETLENGQIQLGGEPTCQDLAQNGFVGIINQKCYGKYFDPNKYYIECESGELLPKKIILLNGADTVTGYNPAKPSVTYPTDVNSATELFDKMQSVSAAKKAEYF